MSNCLSTDIARILEMLRLVPTKVREKIKYQPEDVDFFVVHLFCVCVYCTLCLNIVFICSYTLLVKTRKLLLKGRVAG